MSKVVWVKRWSIMMSDKPVLPGVWKRKDGGHVVRARVKSPKTGAQEEVLRVLASVSDPKHALAWLTAERDRIRRGVTIDREIPRFNSFAALLLREKVDDGSIASASGRKQWARVLEHHLFPAKWASYFLDRVEHADLVEWRSEIATIGWERHVVKDGKKSFAARGERYSPNTLNDWLKIARVIWKAAKNRFGLAINPMDGIEDFSTARHRTYTEEEPNALTVKETGGWLATFLRLFPQHYGMTFLGLVIGQRPSTLRPLRRRGPNADINFKTGKLFLRRSNTVSDEVEDFTKTAKDTTVTLPPSVLTVLKWHVKTQMKTQEMRDSELLFPSEEGGFRSRSCLDKPFDRVTAECGIAKNITPRALRRTFQDLSRAAQIEGVVAKAISNHATDAMRIKYSTAQEEEVLQGIARVVNLVSGKPARRKAG